MKNIHVLPTDKPSKLYRNLLTNKLFILRHLFMDVSECNRENQNIYITSDEEIKTISCKDTNWYIDFRIANKPILSNTPIHEDKIKCCKKIILTTDQDLIKDGVQAIDNEFLEWFVKNPSCEFVEVLFSYKSVNELPISYYRIVIPKEEPKQDLPQLGTKEFNNLASAYFGGKPKQERIGDFIKRESTSVNESIGIIKGANWQAERMYSEEDLKEICVKYHNMMCLHGNAKTQEWFEQFKKK